MPVTLEPSPPAGAHVIAAFMRSVTDVFRTMLRLEVKIGKPFLKQDPLPTYDISGVIGLSGNYVGSMVFSLQKSTAESLVSAFAGMPIATDSPDFADAVGELSNMIAGSAKTSFGEGTSISTPNIILGAGHTIARLHDVPCVIIPCSTPAGEFAVEVNLKPPAARRNTQGGAA